MHRTFRALLGIALVTPVAAGAQANDARINAAVERFTPQITELRHRIYLRAMSSLVLDYLAASGQ